MCERVDAAVPGMALWYTTQRRRNQRWFAVNFIGYWQIVARQRRRSGSVRRRVVVRVRTTKPVAIKVDLVNRNDGRCLIWKSPHFATICRNQARVGALSDGREDCVTAVNAQKRSVRDWQTKTTSRYHERLASVSSIDSARAISVVIDAGWRSIEVIESRPSPRSSWRIRRRWKRSFYQLLFHSLGAFIEP